MKKLTALILTAVIALSCMSLIGYADEAAGLTDFAISAAETEVKAADEYTAQKKTSWFKSDDNYYLFVPS